MQIFDQHRDRIAVRLTEKRTPFSSWCIVAGRPPGSFDCLARSKSDNMICPDWCNRMSRDRIHMSELFAGEMRLGSGAMEAPGRQTTYFLASGLDK